MVKASLKTVSHVDLSRYMGDWFVIANIPYFAEKNCYDSTESYALRADGEIDNWFTCRKGSFTAPMKRKATAKAVVKDPVTNATWSVTFLKVISVKYQIIDLDPSYQWAVVGHPSRRYGWILARTKAIDATTYAGIVRRLNDQGYDTTKFALVPQRPSQSTTSN